MKPSDFVSKNEYASPPRMDKRVYLDKQKTIEFMKELDGVFKSKVSVSTIRARSKQQRFETLINEEALLLAKYLRNENTSWAPRI